MTQNTRAITENEQVITLMKLTQMDGTQRFRNKD